MKNIDKNIFDKNNFDKKQSKNMAKIVFFYF